MQTKKALIFIFCTFLGVHGVTDTEEDFEIDIIYEK